MFRKQTQTFIFVSPWGSHLDVFLFRTVRSHFASSFWYSSAFCSSVLAASQGSVQAMAQQWQQQVVGAVNVNLAAAQQIVQQPPIVPYGAY